MAIEKIIKQNVSDTVFETLRQEIINGSYRSGDRLPATAKLSEQFGVSVATIKLALHHLSALGLIETRTGQGSFVLAFNPYQYLNQVSDFLLTENDISDVTEYRLYFETATAELAMMNATDENFQKMELLLRQMDECRPKKDAAMQGDLDYQFHLEIARATQNSIFLLVYELVEKICHKHTIILNERHYKETVNLKAGTDVHWRLYRAIKAKDIKMCRKCYMEMLNYQELKKNSGNNHENSQ
jgi:GntR family transcriptional repressor for pyruvate dehydrogenase complex